MASAIPYDPDDFENNNPFAEPDAPAHDPEPHTLQQQYAAAIASATQNTAIGSTDTQDATVADAAADGADQAKSKPAEHAGELVKEELVRLLPERFSNRYLIQLTLRAIEENKPENPILRFDAAVSGLSKFRQKEYKDIRRTYSEVSKFNKYLLVANLEVFVPVIPLPVTAYVPGGEDERKQLMFVWQEWMDRVTHNPILVRDEEFVYFIEKDFGYSVINSSRRYSVASGLVRKTLKQLPVPYDPYTELAEFRPLIKSAYLLGQKLHRALERKQRSERQIAALISELSTKLKGLAQFETVHLGMKNMWEKLAHVAHTQSELTVLQLVSDMGSLGDGIKAIVDDLYEIKEALTNRHLITREFIQAQAQTKAKHLNATKIKSRSSLDPIKVDEALNLLEVATRAEENLNMQVKRISGEMMFERKETIEFLERKFQRMLKQFALGRVDQHRRLLKHLENIRLDVRIIDSNGGLSRLNRDNLTQMKHNLPQSQAENGDSWTSRTFRSRSAELKDREMLSGDTEEVEVDAKQAASVLGVATF